MNSERTAVILNAYSYHNAGDAAIMLSTASILRSMDYQRILLATRYDDEGKQYAPWQVQVVSPPVKFPALGASRSALRAFKFAASAAISVCLFSLPPAITQRRQSKRLFAILVPNIREFINADLLVIAGGGYLYSSQRKLNLSLIHSCLMIWLARRTGKPLLVMPASIGPLHRRVDRFLIERAIRTTPYVVRERVSLQQSSVEPRGLTLIDCPDIAFMAPRWADLQNVVVATDKSRNLIRVVAMNWTWSRSVLPERYQAYKEQMAMLCDGLVERGFSVVLGGHSALPAHGQDDIAVCEEVASLCIAEVTVDRNCDPAHLYQEYARSVLVIGTRLHSCIMAVAVETPAIAVGYQEKARGVSDSVAGIIPVFAVDTFQAGEILSIVPQTIALGVGAALESALARIDEVYRP